MGVSCRRGILVGLVSSLLIVVFASGALADSAGVRLWYAGYERTWKTFDAAGDPTHSEKSDEGDDILYMLQYDMTGEEWILSLLAGYGQGWGDIPEGSSVAEKDTTRIDLLAGLAYRWQYIFAGLGFHYTQVETERRSMAGGIWTLTYNFYGPELVAGGGFPVTDWLVVHGTASYMPYLMWERDRSDDEETYDGDTDAYTFDAGASVMWENLRLGAGYRSMRINRYDWETDSGKASYAEQFEGPYVLAGMNW